MNMRAKLLLGASLAFVATAAQAQTVPFVAPLFGDYNEDPFASDATPATVTNSAVVGGLYDSTAVQTGTTSFSDGFTPSMSATVSGVTVTADVTGLYNTQETTVTHIDTVTPANTVTDPSVYINSLNQLYSFDVAGSASTGTTISSTDISTVPGTISGNTVQVTQTNSTIGAGGINFASYDGTATYIIYPDNGNLNYVEVDFDSTPTSNTTLDASGLSTTGSVNAPVINTALINGTGVDGALTLHGGTSSTTVTIDNNGVVADLNDDGTPDFGALIDGSGHISGGINGDWGVTGELSVTGQTFTNGITNNGVIKTNGVNVTGAIVNSAVTGVPDAAPVVVFDNFLVTGVTTLAGQLNANAGIANTSGANGGSVFINDTLLVSGAATTNGITNNGNIATTTLAVSGATTTTGITNTGNIATTTLSTTGAATVGGTLAVTGATTLTGALTANGGVSTTTLATSGNATIGGNTVVTGNITTVAGTITGATLVSTGATSVGTNLTVGGTVAVVGNYTSTNGSVTTTNGNIRTVNGDVSAGNVVMSAATGKISGLTNATLSSTSTEAVTGQQLFATNGRVGALESGLTALTGRVGTLESNVASIRNKAYQGVAMGFALNAAPLNLANGEKGISGGVGVYQGEWAAGVKAQFVTESGFGIGANVGFSEDAVGGGVGASMKF